MGVAVVVVVATATLSGCGEDTESPVSARDLVGKPLAFTATAAPAGVGRAVQDLGASFGVEPEFAPTDWGSSRYVVIAACSDDSDVRHASNLQIGVVESEALSAKQIAQAVDGEFDAYIGCSEGFAR